MTPRSAGARPGEPTISAAIASDDDDPDAQRELVVGAEPLDGQLLQPWRHAVDELAADRVDRRDDLEDPGDEHPGVTATAPATRPATAPYNGGVRLNSSAFAPGCPRHQP